MRVERTTFCCGLAEIGEMVVGSAARGWHLAEGTSEEEIGRMEAQARRSRAIAIATTNDSEAGEAVGRMLYARGWRRRAMGRNPQTGARLKLWVKVLNEVEES